MPLPLSDAVVRRLPLPAKGSKVTYDAGEPKGFGVCITRAGHRSFVLNFVTKAGRERRIAIGSAANWTTTEARAEARRLRQIVDQGGDPLADIEDARAAPTVAELITRFKAEHLPRTRPSTAKDYGLMLATHIGPHFGEHAKVADVAFADIDRLHRKITAAGHLHRANRTIAVLSKMFSLSIRWGMRDTNPCLGVEKNKEHGRKRYLKNGELERLVAALNAYPDRQASDAIRFLLLTGARRTECLSARWADIDLTAGVWSKPATSTKQNAPHEVPLSAPARQLLSEIRQRQSGKRHVLGEFVFPGTGGTGHMVELKRAWRQLCKAAGISGLRVHDLRHSFASQLVSGGATLPLIGALLGHSNPATTHRYSHLYDDPLRAAVERVGAVITAAGEPTTDPIPLTPGRRR